MDGVLQWPDGERPIHSLMLTDLDSSSTLCGICSRLVSIGNVAWSGLPGEPQRENHPGLEPSGIGLTRNELLEGK